MITLKSYASGEWKAGEGDGRVIHHAVNGEEIAVLSSEGLDLAAMLEYGRSQGGPTLRAMTFHDRAALLKKMAGLLNENRDELNQIASTYGATKRDAMFDVDGGIATLGFYAGLGAKTLPASTFLVDGEVARLSKPGNFVGRHVYVPLEGVVVQINAYNFPSWGMLEKLGNAVGMADFSHGRASHRVGSDAAGLIAAPLWLCRESSRSLDLSRCRGVHRLGDDGSKDTFPFEHRSERGAREYRGGLLKLHLAGTGRVC